MYDVDLILDVNTDIYKLREKEKFGLALCSTLRLDGAPDEGTYDQVGLSCRAHKPTQF